jgi:hypothetical protein
MWSGPRIYISDSRKLVVGRKVTLTLKRGKDRKKPRRRKKRKKEERKR